MRALINAVIDAFLVGLFGRTAVPMLFSATVR
jgi:hypothetical protein